MVPIIFSIDYFANRGIHASVKQASVDGMFAGAISSTVECKPVIRACNAGSWIQTELSDKMDKTQMAHQTAFFRSSLIADGKKGGKVCKCFMVVAYFGFVQYFKSTLEYMA